jgi:hypothetical protein
MGAAMTGAQVQDAAWAICSVASDLQRTTVQWRDASCRGGIFDPAFVVVAARETAKRLYELAEEIERMEK